MVMEMKEINSGNNQYLKTYRKLNKRKWREKLELIPIEGTTLIEEAIKNQVDLSFVIISRGFRSNNANELFLENVSKAKIPIFLVDDSIFRSTAFTENPRGIIGCAKMKRYELENIINTKKDIIMVLNLQDPGNLGTLMRSAKAFEFGGMILTKGSVDPTNEKVIRGSMGAIFNLPYYKEMQLDEKTLARDILKSGYDFVVAIPGGEIDSFDLTLSENPACIVIGNETQGVSEEILSAGLNILKVKIPISAKLNSLNAAVAGSIMMYEVYRSRLYKGL